MKITALVENTTRTGLKTRHGLSLYIETSAHKILFDLGPDNTLFENARKRNIDISKVDTVIISHGHIDHGGALKKFFTVNSSAKVYVQRKAFEPHYSKTWFLKISVGINSELRTHRQVVLLDGDCKIDDELSLFTVEKIHKCYSPVNDVLYEGNNRDSFLHEQNLVISENNVAILTGCGHAGVVNIMDKAEKYQPCFCIGGFHLYNPVTKKTVSKKLLDDIAANLKKYEHTEFYTCHCTGEKAFKYLSHQMNILNYISCGDTIEV